MPESSSSAAAGSGLARALEESLPGLSEMVADLSASPPVVQPSAYWQHINARNMEQLADAGFFHFKRSINQNYFAFVPCHYKDDQFRAVLRSWCRKPALPALLPRRIDTTGLQTIFNTENPLAAVRPRLIHAAYLALLWEFVRRGDRLGVLESLEEPSLGAPVTIVYRGRRISQDLCNSVHEFYAMQPDGVTPARSVVELGGGYGRIAWVFLSCRPDVRYIMCDIPPALAVAQRYLTTLFPDRRTFRFRRFGAYSDVAEEFERSSIAFVTPGQLDLLPPLKADLFVNVSSLHEMRRDQIRHYLEMVDRHCAGLFYTKQWKVSTNPHDNIVVRRDDYPIPSQWEPVFSRSHDIQTQFFEALYQVRGSGSEPPGARAQAVRE